MISPSLVEARDMLLSELKERYYGTSRVDVASTFALRSLARVPAGTPFKEFKPGLFTSYARSYIVPLVVGIILVSLFTLGQVVYWMIIIGVLMIVTSLIADNRRGHRLHIDDKGITIEGSTYWWSDVAETAILTGTVHVNTREQRDITYLILVFRQGGYRKLDLGKYHAFWGLNAELSRYIEYFKASATGPPASTGASASTRPSAPNG